MALSNEWIIYVQNSLHTWVFTAVFFATIVFLCSWLWLAIALVSALALSFAYRKLAGKLLTAAPRKAAVFITGASSGIGRETALRLARCGFLVFSGVRKSDDGDSLRKSAGSNATAIVPVIIDVTKQEHINAALDTIKKRLTADDRKLHAVINNAGGADAGAVEMLTPAAWKQAFELNVFSVVAVTQAFIPLLRQTAATSADMTPRVVIIGSSLGRMVPAGLASYSASKHAVRSIADGFRQELTKWRIDVVLIEPGALETNFVQAEAKSVQKNVANAASAIQKKELYLEPEVLEHYSAAMQKHVKARTSHKRGSVLYAVDAIECAVLETRPLQRYGAGFDSMLIPPILMHIPTEIHDMIFGKAFA